MKKPLGSTLKAYPRYLAAIVKGKAHGVLRYLASASVGAYLLTLCFPQFLFAHEASYKSFSVYSTEPLDQRIYAILDGAETRLSRSTIYDRELSRRVFLTNSHVLYAFLSNKAFRSFANSVPLIDNVLVNRSDVGRDLVFLDRPEHNKRSLTGVIAHEVTHLFIRKRVGTLLASVMPAWKNEGYCEYVAGDSTITHEEGVRLWRANPQDESKYRHFKYQMMVRYLLENERLSLEEVFDRDFDMSDLENKVFRSL